MICLKAVSTVYKTKMNIALNTLVECQVANFVLVHSLHLCRLVVFTIVW